MVATATRIIEFANTAGDRLRTRRVRLEPRGTVYAMTITWQPVVDGGAGAWSFSMSTSGGESLVSGVIVRDRTPLLAGIVNAQRPAGEIICYSASERADPGLDAFEDGGYRLLYLPGGYDPETFSISQEPG